MDYSDTELLKWLIVNQNHRGKALAALSESLVSFRETEKGDRERERDKERETIGTVYLSFNFL